MKCQPTGEPFFLSPGCTRERVKREAFALSETDELSGWLEASYASAYRTACLILRNPADAEEAVQEAFLRVWRFRAAVPADDGARPWLYRVLVNACCSKLRSDATRRSRTAGGDLPDVAGSDPSPEASAAAAETAAAVREALSGLPEHLRIAVVLRYYAGLTEREIASAIRRRPGTVKSRLHEARRLLSTDTRLAGFASSMEMEQ